MSELFDSRKQFLNNLVSLLLSDNRMVDESLSVSIDAGWGFGKTFFLNKLAERLKDDGHMVVQFNAWETDLSNDAFISFADSLFTQLAQYLSDTSTFFEKADLAMIAFGSLMLDRFVSGLPIVGKVKEAITGTREKYKDLVEHRGSYFIKDSKNSKSGLELVKEKVEESLEEFFSKLKPEYQDKRVVILVDELDRCRPDYSVQVLERVKHLFKDSRLSFVFAINKEELEKSITQTYGSINVPVYFEKFFTFSFRLPEIDIDSFLESDIPFAGNDDQKVYYDLLVQMVKDSHRFISLRQVERVFNYFEAVCRIVPDFDSFTPAPYLIPIAVFSKVMDNDFFHSAFEKRNVSKYYSYGGPSSVWKNSVYDRFQSYTLDGREGWIPIFQIMATPDDLSISRPGCYVSNNGKLKLSNSRGESIRLIRSDSEDLPKIYHVVDCLM